MSRGKITRNGSRHNNPNPLLMLVQAIWYMDTSIAGSYEDLGPT